MEEDLEHGNKGMERMRRKKKREGKHVMEMTLLNTNETGMVRRKVEEDWKNETKWKSYRNN